MYHQFEVAFRIYEKCQFIFSFTFISLSATDGITKLTTPEDVTETRPTSMGLPTTLSTTIGLLFFIVTHCHCSHTLTGSDSYIYILPKQLMYFTLVTSYFIIIPSEYVK